MQVEILELEELFPDIQLKFGLRDPRPEKNMDWVRDKIFYVGINGSVKLKEGGYRSTTGDGNTLDNALIDLCKFISTETIVVGLGTDNKQYKLPTIVHTKLLNK